MTFEANPSTSLGTSLASITPLAFFTQKCYATFTISQGESMTEAERIAAQTRGYWEARFQHEETVKEGDRKRAEAEAKRLKAETEATANQAEEQAKRAAHEAELKTVPGALKAAGLLALEEYAAHHNGKPDVMRKKAEAATRVFAALHPNKPLSEAVQAHIANKARTEAIKARGADVVLQIAQQLPLVSKKIPGLAILPGNTFQMLSALTSDLQGLIEPKAINMARSAKNAVISAKDAIVDVGHGIARTFDNVVVHPVVNAVNFVTSLPQRIDQGLQRILNGAQAAAPSEQRQPAAAAA